MAQAVVCQNYKDLEKEISIYFLIVASALIIVLSFFEKRRRLCLNLCDGRPHLLSPMDFTEGRRTILVSYTLCFAVIVRKFLGLIGGEWFWLPSAFEDPDFSKNYGWLRVVFLIGNTLHLCLISYPLLACLKMRKFLFANIAGLSYLILWVWRFFARWIACPPWNEYKEYTSEVGEQNTPESVTSSNILQKNYAIGDIIFDIPVLLCIVGLVCIYILDIYRNIVRKFLSHKQFSKFSDETDHPAAVQYLKALLNRKPHKEPSTRFGKLKFHLKYTNVPGFKYSPMILCTVTIVVFLLLKLTIEETIKGNCFLETISQIMKLCCDENASSSIMTGITGSYYVAIYASLLLHFLWLIRIVVLYRRHLLQYYRGDRSWHYKKTVSPMMTVVQSMKYGGYQIAFMLYGYVINAFLVFVIGATLTLIFTVDVLWRSILTYLPYVVVAVLIYILQLILARYVFLQESKKQLHLDNRRLFQVFSFFMFFFNALVGIVTCLKRVIFALVINMVFISRLDQCLAFNGMERLDPGFNTYISMLQFEVQQNHPVMKAFVILLMKGVEAKRIQDAVDNVNAMDKYREMKNEISAPRKLKWRNKWFKAITLINNPSVTKDFAKHSNTEEKYKLVEVIIDKLGDCAAATACMCCASVVSDT